MSIGCQTMRSLAERSPNAHNAQGPGSARMFRTMDTDNDSVRVARTCSALFLRTSNHSFPAGVRTKRTSLHITTQWTTAHRPQDHSRVLSVASPISTQAKPRPGVLCHAFANKGARGLAADGRRSRASSRARAASAAERSMRRGPARPGRGAQPRLHAPPPHLPAPPANAHRVAPTRGPLDTPQRA